MTPCMLRQFWTVVEQTQTTMLLNLDESTLSSSLIHQLSENYLLSAQEADACERYIRSKLPLIRDLAQAR